jgi:Protein of unknown function (DUF3999)
MIFRTLTLRSALCLAIFTVATPSVRYFHYTRPIYTTPAQSGQTCINLDPEVFAQSGPRLASLRLYQGQAIHPYAIAYAAPLQPSAKPITPLNLGVRNEGLRNGSVVFDAIMPFGPYSDLDLSINAHDFIATVRVSGSQSQSGPTTSLGSYTVFDFTRQKLGRSTILHLPQSDFRYLHFSVSGPLQPTQITSLTADRLPAGAPQYVTVAATPQIAEQGHDSIVTFAIPPNIPVDRIRFSIGPRPINFSRQVSVSVRPALPPTQNGAINAAITTFGNLLRIHTTRDGHKIDEERLAIPASWPASSFSSATGTRWTITIHNQDDPPLDIRSVSLQMIARNLCFDAAPSAAYTLYYGDSALSPPHYDYATLFSLNKNAARATLGPEQLNPLYTPRPDTRPYTEKHPALLWIALIAAILILGVIALRSARHLRQP